MAYSVKEVVNEHLFRQLDRVRALEGELLGAQGRLKSAKADLEAIQAEAKRYGLEDVPEEVPYP